MVSASCRELVAEVLDLAGRLQADASLLARAHGLTVTQARVMGAVLVDPETVPVISRRLSLGRTSVQSAVHALVRSKDVELSVDDRSRVSSLVGLTPRGRERIERYVAADRVLVDRAVSSAGVAPAALQDATAVIEQLRAAFGSRAHSMLVGELVQSALDEAT